MKKQNSTFDLFDNQKINKEQQQQVKGGGLPINFATIKGGD
ncbi:MAG: hypothetical protein AAFZ15_13255 [Bacteroidota bacterium]